MLRVLGAARTGQGARASRYLARAAQMESSNLRPDVRSRQREGLRLGARGGRQGGIGETVLGDSVDLDCYLDGEHRGVEPGCGHASRSGLLSTAARGRFV